MVSYYCKLRGEMVHMNYSSEILYTQVVLNIEELKQYKKVRISSTHEIPGRFALY